MPQVKTDEHGHLLVEVDTDDKTLPNLANYTAEAIADECGPYQEAYSRLDKLTKYLKTGLKARAGEIHKLNELEFLIKGEKYYATITLQQSARFDQTKAKEFLTEEQFSQCFITTSAEVVRFQRVTIQPPTTPTPKKE